MRISELLFEAAYDSMIASMKKKYTEPEQIEAIDWGKKHLKKADRVVWYLRLLGNYLANPSDTKVFDGKSLKEFQDSLLHYIGQESISKIQNYVFKSQSPKQVFDDLEELEQEHIGSQKQVRPSGKLDVEGGDYPLIKFSNGSAWYFLNRGYCDIEGKSGLHCGNVVGQHKTDQRILSYRGADGRVILTFVLEPDGTLGEMKHIGNTKPPEKYHPAIIQLLLNPMVKGITGMGYLPDANFSVFDLDDASLRTIANKKPSLIVDQLGVTPIEILRAPQWIKDNPEYRRIALRKLPAIEPLIDSPTIENWEAAINKNPLYIIYAPDELPDYRDRLLNYLYNKNDSELLLKVRNKYRKDFNFLNELLSKEPDYLEAIPANTRGYDKLVVTAVNRDEYAIRHVPKESRTPEMYLAAVRKTGTVLNNVPKELKTPEICLAAVQQNGYALRYVPKELMTPELCLAAVKQDGEALPYVPKELKTPEICLAAVKQNGNSLMSVPEKLKTPEICLAAVKQNGKALAEVPKELRTSEMCLAAVQQNGEAVYYVPPEIFHKIKSEILQTVKSNQKPTVESIERLQLLAGIRDRYENT